MQKSLTCSFCHINSSIDFKVRPVWLDQAFHKLSNNIKFAEFGEVDLKLFEFELDTSLYFDRIVLKQFQIGGLARESKRAEKRGDRLGRPSNASMRHETTERVGPSGQRLHQPEEVPFPVSRVIRS